METEKNRLEKEVVNLEDKNTELQNRSESSKSRVEELETVISATENKVLLIFFLEKNDLYFEILLF